MRNGLQLPALLAMGLALGLVFGSAGQARADVIVRYNLEDVTFVADGGTATGWFDYDVTHGGVTAWDIVSTAPGDSQFAYELSSSLAGNTVDDRTNTDWNATYSNPTYTGNGTGGPGYNGGAIDFNGPGYFLVLAYDTNLETDPTSEPLYARSQSLSPGGDCSYESGSSSSQRCLATGFLVQDGFDPAPEPASMALLGTGLSGLAFLRRRRKV